MNRSLTIEDVGFSAVTSDALSVEHARRLRAALDADVQLEEGRELPLLWHWAFFAPFVATADLGHDGHPRMETGGPAAGLPRRMWAGGRIQRRAALLLGQPATRRSRLTEVERKSGRSGDLLVVTVEHQVEQGGQVAVVEEQDLVYRSAPKDPLPHPVEVPTGDIPAGDWCDVVTIDPIRLFRFSALTFNSHRIHYDRPYATSEEGYPELVVHGPLTAILLAGAARRRVGPGSAFSFRAAAPLFANSPIRLIGGTDHGETHLEAVRVDRVVAMTAAFVALQP